MASQIQNDEAYDLANEWIREESGIYDIYIIILYNYFLINHFL
jgi:hypothetical protein